MILWGTDTQLWWCSLRRRAQLSWCILLFGDISFDIYLAKGKKGGGDNVILNIQYLSFHSNLLFLSERGVGTKTLFEFPLPTCDYVSLMCLYAGQQLNASCVQKHGINFYSVHMYDRRDHFKQFLNFADYW